MKNPLFYALSICILCLPGCESSENTSYVSPIDSVNPMIGTGGHGHTYPGATVPFGSVQLSPDSRLDGWDGCGGYHSSDSVLYGFSHTHLQGTGISDYADVLFMPTNSSTKEGDNWSERYSSTFSKDSEVASPGYYSVFLDDHQMKVELTTTARTGIHRYVPANPKDSITLFIDMAHRDPLIEYSLYPQGDSLILGHRISREWAQEQHVYFVASFSSPFDYRDQTFEIERSTDPETGAVTEEMALVPVFPLVFDPLDTLIIKVGVSAVSIEGAWNNMTTEAAHWDFDTYHQDARNLWSEALRKIEIQGGTSDEQTIFYTSLYHSLTTPNLYMDTDGKYRGTDLEVHQAEGFTNYTIFSLWDTFRATHPLFTLIERERTRDFMHTFLNMYRNGGQLPIWELAGNYTGCMIGYHSVSAIADAHTKGIYDFDEALALEAMIQIADSVHLGKDHFAEEGFITSEKEHESVSKNLEYAYNDWCIATMADALNKPEIAERFHIRSQYYKNLYNPESGFMQPKRNGGWLEPFDPYEVNFNFTEANSYQYSFFVPQDVSGLIELHGGGEKFCTALDGLFNAETQTTGRNQADITGLIGQYAHGNEPSHHMAYLYSYAGKPWETQKYTRRIMDELYWNGPDGLSGNEDCGQMSSWYVLSAMGFYSVTPGSDVWVFGSPKFDRIILNLEEGNKLEITANNNSKQNIYIQSVTRNGVDYPYSFMRHGDLMTGGTLTFEMGPNPNKNFASEVKFRPQSTAKGQKICPVPVIKTQRTFIKPFNLEIRGIIEGGTIYYTINEEEAVHTYTGPVQIDETSVVTAWVEKEGFLTSKKVTANMLKIDGSRSLELHSQYANQYAAGGPNTLIDFLRGGTDYQTGEWQGYQGMDFEAVVDLGEKKPIKLLALGCLQDTRPWILFPEIVSFSVSDDGVNFTSVGQVKNDVPVSDYSQQTKDFELKVSASARYIKVNAKSQGQLPDWHLGSGGDSWLFMDEIVVR